MHEPAAVTAEGARRPLLRADNVSRHFDVSPPLLNRLLTGKKRTILKAVERVSFSIAQGETFALVGESGCGKSTVARLAVGLYRPTAGTIEFDGTQLGGRRRGTLKAVRRRVQMIFQDPYASLNPRWFVRDIVAEPLRLHGGNLSRAEIRDKVDDLLALVKLSPADGAKYPHEFSGGQRQRISIARALSSDPDFLICDEPTSALDVSVQAQVLNLMADLQDRLGLTYLFISHNLAVVDHVATRVGVMYLGRLVEVADAGELFHEPAHPYTRLLLDTVPLLKAGGRERPAVAGEVPSPIDAPPGCAFHPRCGMATDRCRVDRPELLPFPGQPNRTVACHAVAEGRL